MNMGVTLAVYGAICRETGRGFHFPGSREQWEAVTDVTDAGLLADHLVWAATTPAAANEALNIVNGDVFRWRRLWPRLAAALGVEPVPFNGEPAPLEQQMADAGEIWPEIVRRHGLRDLGVEKPGLVVAHRRRPRTHGRDVHGHGAQPAARLPRRARHRVLVHRPLRAPAGRADRAVRVGVRRCGRFASTPRATSGSRRSPSRPRRGPGRSSSGSSTCGICGTDLHEYMAGPIVTPVEPHPLTGAQNPQILGHEFAGDVVAVGPGVTRVEAGDRVAIMPLAYCGQCAYCRRGLQHLCATMGCVGLSHAWGGMAELATVAEYQIVPLPEGVTHRQGALIEPTAVAAYGVERAGVGPGDQVLVTGAGPIGALAALCARSAGASTVYVSEPNPARRARAEALGVATVLDPTAIDVPAFLHEQSDGLGIDVAIECSGHPSGFDTGDPLAAPAGHARADRAVRRRGDPSSRCCGRSTT